MKVDKCKLCKDTTEIQYYNIDFVRYCVCSCCADNILLQTIQSNLINKWKTYRELKNQKELEKVEVK